MTDYKDLANRLRERSVLLFPHHGEQTNYDADLMNLAADAIEVLQARLLMAEETVYELKTTAEHYKGCADDWYREACDYKAAVPKWISVTERLPDIEDDVLIYCERTGLSGAKYREIWLTDFKEFLHLGYKPIAWMPLPEPPKEEKA